MDIRKELNNFPNFAYVVFRDGKERLVILGGHTCPKIESISNLDRLLRLNDEMQELYFKNDLTQDDKIRLAQLMKKTMNLCEGRLENNYTLDQQIDYIDSLPLESKKEIEKQLQMYKACREYYRDFIYRN